MRTTSGPGRVVGLALIALAAALAPPLAAPAHATFVPPVSMSDLWSYADCVIEATVDSTTCNWNSDSTMIWTQVHLEVLAVDQGPCLTGPRTLSFLGGAMGSIGMDVIMAPTFAAGEHVLLFLDETPNQLCPTIAMNVGKFTIAFDTLRGRETISNGRFGVLDRATLFAARRATGNSR